MDRVRPGSDPAYARALGELGQHRQRVALCGRAGAARAAVGGQVGEELLDHRLVVAGRTRGRRLEREARTAPRRRVDGDAAGHHGAAVIVTGRQRAGRDVGGAELAAAGQRRHQPERAAHPRVERRRPRRHRAAEPGPERRPPPAATPETDPSYGSFARIRRPPASAVRRRYRERPGCKQAQGSPAARAASPQRTCRATPARAPATRSAGSCRSGSWAGPPRTPPCAGRRTPSGGRARTP